MDEANYRLQQTPNVAQARTMGKAVRVLAIREAIKAVKQRMHAEGLQGPSCPS